MKYGKRVTELSYKVTKKVYVSWGEFLSLVYHDIFEYPLMGKELVRWRTASVVGRVVVEKTGSFYHLPGRSHIILRRLAQENYSREKIARATQAAQIISKISTVQFVGITGSLAMNNAGKESDIDLFFITSVETLWITRLLVYAFLRLNGLATRKSGQKKEVNDLFCLNLWLDQNNLSIPPNMRNFYTAHEVLQVVPLVNKNRTFEKFLVSNSWASKYWPNVVQVTELRSYKVTKKLKATSSVTQLLRNLITLLCKFIEPLAYRLQRWYMSRRRTRELIEPGRAFFHPVDWGGFVMREFEQKTRKYSNSMSFRQPTHKRWVL